MSLFSPQINEGRVVAVGPGRRKGADGELIPMGTCVQQQPISHLFRTLPFLRNNLCFPNNFSLCEAAHERGRETEIALIS